MTPPLHTARLQLRWLQADAATAAFVLELVNSEGWLRYIGDRQIHTPEAALQFLRDGPLASRARHGFALLEVVHTPSGTSVGLCGLLRRDDLDAPDIGFAFLPAHHRQGYAREAARAVLDWGRLSFGLQRVLALVHPDNRASQALLSGLGFVPRGRIQRAGQGESLLLETTLTSASGQPAADLPSPQR